MYSSSLRDWKCAVVYLRISIRLLWVLIERIRGVWAFEISVFCVWKSAFCWCSHTARKFWNEKIDLYPGGLFPLRGKLKCETLSCLSLFFWPAYKEDRKDTSSVASGTKKQKTKSKKHKKSKMWFKTLDSSHWMITHPKKLVKRPTPVYFLSNPLVWGLILNLQVGETPQIARLRVIWSYSR